MNKIFLVAVLSVILILFGCAQKENIASEQPVLDLEVDGAVAEETATESAEETSDVQEITMFDVHGSNYKFNPVEIRVKKGETVRINFVNDEGFHNFIVDDLNLRTETISDGNVDTVTFVPDKVGEFEFYCGVGNHRELGMEGILVVEP